LNVPEAVGAAAASPITAANVRYSLVRCILRKVFQLQLHFKSTAS
jgi:hypothetical protein